MEYEKKVSGAELEISFAKKVFWKNKKRHILIGDYLLDKMILIEWQNILLKRDSSTITKCNK